MSEATVALPRQASTATDRVGALFDAHHARLYRLARRLSRSGDDARDLVQETFLRVARAPGRVPAGAEREEAWLVRVLVNLCRDRWRQQAARHRLDALNDGLRPATSGDPEAAAIAHSIVWRALDVLSPRRRAVVVLYELEGLGVDAISRLLGIARVTVRWHLSRGRAEIEQIIRSLESKP